MEIGKKRDRPLSHRFSYDELESPHKPNKTVDEVRIHNLNLNYVFIKICC